MSNYNQVPQTTSSNGWAWFWMVVAILYSVSPIDIIPDFIPVVGWADDILSLGTAGLNLLQSFTAKSNETLSSILKTLKYFLLIGGVIIVLILALIALLVYKAFV
ncbi:MAG: DUF1232 domain-containing protein [Muribaculaceae bacterium]|nr:DUF1232 domain-containing protein [Muribaculaceae bacterium]